MASQDELGTMDLSKAPRDAPIVALLRKLARSRGSATIVGSGADGAVVRAEVQLGAIVFVAVAGGPFLSDRIVAECEVTREQLSQTVAHCRLSGRRLAEQLLFEGVMTPRQLQSALRQHNRAQLQRAADDSTPLAWEVFDQPHTFGEMFTFPLVELWDDGDLPAPRAARVAGSDAAAAP
jgi:hypothetical protein